VETLAVRHLVRNRRLAQAISDASWSELVRQLEYKAAWYGRTLVMIDKWYPSTKRCSNCGHVLESLPLSVRQWTCPACGVSHDRDVNACGEAIRPGRAMPASARPNEAGISRLQPWGVVNERTTHVHIVTVLQNKFVANQERLKLLLIFEGCDAQADLLAHLLSKRCSAAYCPAQRVESEIASRIYRDLVARRRYKFKAKARTRLLAPPEQSKAGHLRAGSMRACLHFPYMRVLGWFPQARSDQERQPFSGRSAILGHLDARGHEQINRPLQVTLAFVWPIYGTRHDW
jgi:hypothetical protein